MKRLFVCFVLSLLTVFSPVAMADRTVVAVSGDDEVAVELYAEKCDIDSVLQRIKEGVPADLTLGPISLAKLQYKAEGGETLMGCWFLIPIAPTVILVWENSGHGNVPMEAFSAPKEAQEVK